MSTKEYTSRLRHLSDSNKDIVSRITRLSKLVPEPGVPPSQEVENRTELGEDIHSSLKELESDFDLFKQEVEDIVSPPGGAGRRASTGKENERLALLSQIERFGEDLKLSRGQFRRAQLQAKRNEEEAQRKAREQLFAGANADDGDRPLSAKRRGRDENKTEGELTLSAAGDVTAGLRRLHQQLDDSLGRNAYAKEILEISTAALRELDETYSSVVEQGLKTARGLVTKLISSQKSDTWYLETALYILVGTITWLIFRRWFFGPFFYLLYEPSRFMLSIVYSALNLTLSVLTGTIFSGAQVDVAKPEVTTNTRPPLIIKPSAGDGEIVKRQGSVRPSVKVGLGGGGPGEGRSPEEKQKDAEGLIEELAKMAEKDNDAKKVAGEAAKIQHEASGAAGGAAQPTVRGDGTVLRQRTADEKPNPKKRVLEEPPQAKDEL